MKYKTCNTIKIPNIFIFTDPFFLFIFCFLIFFELAEISGIGQVMANNYLGLALSMVNLHSKTY